MIKWKKIKWSKEKRTCTGWFDLTLDEQSVHAYYIETMKESSTELTTPENTRTYHNALCLSPQSFA